MTDTLTEKAQGTFDLDEFVQGRGFPRDSVTVFTNEDAGYDYTAVQERLKELVQDKEKLGEATRSKAYRDILAEMAPLEEKAAALLEKIKESALTFHLRGISPGHIKKINKDVAKEAEKEEWEQDHAAEEAGWRIIAAHIIEVVNAKGETDKRSFDAERVGNLEMILPESEWRKLDRKVAELSFKSAYLDVAVDAGFLPKS
jgi:hypothetical protein